MKRIIIFSILLISVSKTYGQPFDIQVENVPLIQQPSTMSCWAAAFTMLYSWKNQSSIDIVGAIRSVDDTNEYVQIFHANQGISAHDEKEFYSKAGLKLIEQLNPSIKGWRDLLEKNGPLSITVDADPPRGTIHALVIVGLRGDGTPTGTRVTFIDPADGKMDTIPFSRFITLYEGSANWPNQIVHY